MAEVKQSDSQDPQPDPPLADPAPPVQPSSSTPATSSADLTPEELEMLAHFRKTKRPDSPSKKPKLDGHDQEWQDFLDALSAKDVELSDLDFSLQQELRSSSQARQDFLALNLTTPDTLHYDPDQGKLQKLDLTKKRPFTDLTPVEVPTIETSEVKIRDAMLQYHQSTFLPNHQFMLQACKQFYANTMMEQYYTQLQIDTMDTRVKTLEARLGNRSLILKGLPATGFNRYNLDWNLKFWCERSNVATASKDACAKVWNLDGKCLRSVTGHNQWVRCVAFAPSGPLSDGRVHPIDICNEEQAA
eukprot:s3957_g5.t1